MCSSKMGLGLIWLIRAENSLRGILLPSGTSSFGLQTSLTSTPSICCLGVMDTKARATSHCNLAELKANIIKAWDDLSADFIINSCRSFHPRLEAIIEADGGHIE